MKKFNQLFSIQNLGKEKCNSLGRQFVFTLNIFDANILRIQIEENIYLKKKVNNETNTYFNYKSDDYIACKENILFCYYIIVYFVYYANSELLNKF